MNWRMSPNPSVALMNSTDPFLGCLHVKCLRARVDDSSRNLETVVRGQGTTGTEARHKVLVIVMGHKLLSWLKVPLLNE